MISVCFLFRSTVKVSIRNYTCTIRPSIDLEKDNFFYHGYIYRISVCFVTCGFVFASLVKVSIRNYNRTTRPRMDLQIDHFLSWLCIPDFRMFCISMHSEVSIPNKTCNTRPSVHLEIDHFFIMVLYTGFPYVLYFHVQ